MAELILALDLASKAMALSFLDRLGDCVGQSLRWCKLGMELFTAEGPSLIHELKARELKVFLDLKFYDIPHTVGKAVAQAGKHHVDLLTLHCQGGRRMLLEAKAARDSGSYPTKLFGVTVLTSFADGELPGIPKRAAEYAQDLAQEASECAIDGLVTSAQEVATLKANYPHLLMLCPGIRPSFAQSDDQRRIASPSFAVRQGADYLVVGRPILKAQDPKAATEAIYQEMTAVA